jgi:spore germination protein YaaH
MIKKFALITLVFVPFLAQAAALEVSGWIPYWKISQGVEDARDNLDVLTEINPFTLSVTSSGEVKDLGKMKKSPWTKLFKEARKQDIEIIPTVMWSDTESMYEVLSDSKLRTKHIESIVKFVNKGKYDGIDIDYEGKSAETKDHYSAFLTELKNELGDKTLACTIEARTPPESLYNTVPKTIAYANDFAVIGEVCDQVRIMTYDQQRADLKLNNAKSGVPYIPVADIDWVEKVARLTIASIPKEKVMLGVATYGREWEVSVSKNRFGNYASLWTVTHEYSMDFADQVGIEPLRNSAGELSYGYFATSSPYGNMLKNYKVPRNTPDAQKAALQALAYANKTGNTAFVNVVSWSDAEAIVEKLNLAQELGLRGISIFKVDGTEDEALWDMLRENL